MESKKYTSIFFIGVFFFALLLSSATATGNEKEIWIYQGACSKYPDCNKHCIDTGFSNLGGKCVHQTTEKGSPLICVCVAQ
ncbi:hypothetical protein BUALT_Bualt02G0195600 [Buddleja alternifolia]|uniref:Uncharacterized protein n=1 Tax=Buddleja alternifolia TaxID=168488 RepID=A0AAV6Y2T6_9LAMI|nr:hypothetical protein BUALT_Bualt02G0195600 [Buddleja alternifolia]